MTEDSGSPLMDALLPVHGSDKPGDNLVILANGKNCLASDLDFTWLHTKLLRHLEFLQRLNEQQRMNICPEKLLEMSLKLLEVQTVDETAVGATYEDQLDAIACSLDSVARALNNGAGDSE